MADSTIWDLAAESVMLATHRIPVQDTATTTRSQHATFALLGGMEVTTGGDEATAMDVGKLYRVDMSAWATAVRIYSLPTTAQVGERVGVYVTAGNATHEIAIRTTAASNDTINGVDYDSADWSKLFITGEIVIFECVVANTDWIVLHDGRIPCRASMFLAVETTGGVLVDGTFSQVPFDTEEFDVGDIADIASEHIEVRRAGDYMVVVFGKAQNAGLSALGKVAILINITDGAGASRKRVAQVFNASDFTGDDLGGAGLAIFNIGTGDLGGDAARFELFAFQTSGGNVESLTSFLQCFELLAP